MRIMTVEKFFCCLDLRWGAVIVGWIELLISTVALIVMITLFGWTIFAYSDLIELLPSDHYVYDLIKSYPPLLVKFVILMMIVYYGICFYAAKRLVGSIKTRNPSDTIPYLALLIFDLIFSLMSVLHLTWIAFVQALIRTVFYGYIFISIYSFKQLLVGEALRRQSYRNSNYQTAPLTMYKV